MDAAPSSPNSVPSGPVAETTAPPVVAVVVTCNPGWWLEDCLRSLAAQDYPTLSVLVIDADSEEDPTARVAAVMPNAFVRRVKRRRGFATAANEVIGVVEGASHFLFCHDDVALAPDSTRVLVEEAFRSNASVVAPKLTGWFHPDRLLAVGMGMDTFGSPVALVEPGDLDQQQHDSVRDVFYAPSPCSLVRADLFVTLGGFDNGCGIVGEDVDLAWRAHMAGARVVTAPFAVVRHFGATEAGQRGLDGSLAVSGPDAVEQAMEADPLARTVAPEPLPVREHDLVDDLDEEDWADWGDDSDPEPSEHHHPSRRARREARRNERREEESTTGWEEDDWSPRRAARRRQLTAQAVAAAPVEGPAAAALAERRTIARLRSLIVNSGTPRLITRLPFLLLGVLVGAIAALVRGGSTAARRVLHPWSVLFAESGELRKRRKITKKARTATDNEMLALQQTGTATWRAAFGAAAASTPAESRVDDEPRSRIVGVTAVILLLVIGFGTRHLLTGHLPTIGDLAPWPSWHSMESSALSGWRVTGLGVAAPAPTLFGLLTALGVVVLGHMTVLQHLLVLGMFPLGVWGVARLVRPFGSLRAIAVAMVAYLAVPLPYNSLADGRWPGLVAYGAVPWLVALLLRAMSLAPFDAPPAQTVDPHAWPPPRVPRPWLDPRRRLVAIALVAALAAAVQPGLLIVVVFLGVALCAGAMLTGDRAAGIKALGAAVLGAAGGLILLFPWALGWLPPTGEWATFTGAAGSAQATHLGTLLRFDTGPVGGGPIGYALLLAAALPLVIARGRRSDWAIRLWTIAIGSFLLAWAGQHQFLGIVWPSSDVLLAPAAVAVALSLALGVVSFNTDLSGFTFGWRQVAFGVATAAALVACVPVVAKATDGRWQQEQAGYDALLSWMPGKRSAGDFRVLWLGSPDVLPIQGWRSSDGLSYAISRNGPPQLTDDLPATSDGTTRLLDQAILLARRGDTTNMGHLLAPMGVRYIVEVSATAPLANPSRPIPADMDAALQSQLDLGLVDSSPSETVYENAVWAPIRSQLTAANVGAAQLDDPRVARNVTLNQPPPTPVLPTQHGPTTFTGSVGSGTAVEVAEAPSAHWRLRVAGHTASRQPAFGTANLFSVVTGGKATLSYQTPLGWLLAYLIGLALWIAALYLVVQGRRRPKVTL